MIFYPPNEVNRIFLTMASEMETAALFIVSMIRGVRAGAIMAYGSMNDHTIELACDAIKILIEEDKKKAGK